MVSGRAAEGANAITDYVEHLRAALAGLGVEATPVWGRDWGPRGLLDIRRCLRERRPDVLHIQHPVSFHHRSYVPQVLSLTRASVVTLHGGSRYGRFWGKVSLGPFTVRPRHVIFTTREEREHALGWAPWLRRRSSVVPIGANIPARPSSEREPGSVATFGLVRREKGLEDVVELARLAQAAGHGWTVRIIGQTPGPEAGYAARLRESAKDVAVDWASDLGHEEAATALGRTRVAYLPFPDGASERRGSLLACLAAGCAVVTTNGRQTPADLGEAVLFAGSPAEAFAAASKVMADDGLFERLSRAGQAYAERFSWEGIAGAHRTIYERVTGRG
jgi:glycosyltransferase involved in cell wall biosynthesis